MNYAPERATQYSSTATDETIIEQRILGSRGFVIALKYMDSLGLHGQVPHSIGFNQPMGDFNLFTFLPGFWYGIRQVWESFDMLIETLYFVQRLKPILYAPHKLYEIGFATCERHGANRVERDLVEVFSLSVLEYAASRVLLFSYRLPELSYPGTASTWDLCLRAGDVSAFRGLWEALWPMLRHQLRFAEHVNGLSTLENPEDYWDNLSVNQILLSGLFLRFEDDLLGLAYPDSITSSETPESVLRVEYLFYNFLEPLSRIFDYGRDHAWCAAFLVLTDEVLDLDCFVNIREACAWMVQVAWVCFYGPWMERRSATDGI